MHKYEWVIKNDSHVNDIHEVIERIFAGRNLIDLKTDITNSLHPLEYAKKDQEFSNLITNNISLAVKLIKETIDKNLPIIIHGDYDVDGQSSTAIIWRTLYNDLNYKNVFPFIPNRFDHGYGLSESSINDMIKLLESKDLKVENALILTVDCGITADKETEIAKQKGFKIIISDHHSKTETLPKPDALVWTDRATGAGIAWLLSVFLLNPQLLSNLDSNADDTSKYLDLACLGTICDLQPLIGFNRSIVKYGLLELKKEKILGIKVLKELAGIKTDLDTYEIGWVIGPKLNASGRLSDAINSLRLLSTDSLTQAIEISKSLADFNKTRQDKTQNDYLYALKEYQDKENLPAIIITHSKDYHDGIIGLIASKLMQNFNRPALALAIEEDKGVAKGSGRSITGIAITETLRRFNDLFENLGGHDLACGFTIKIERLEELKTKLKELDNEIDKNLFNRKLYIDAILPSELINFDLYNLVNELKPFGVGFTEPIFTTKNYKVNNVFAFGQEQKHVKLELISNTGIMATALMFNGKEILNNINLSEKVDVAYNLSVNTWNGKSSLELKIKDIKNAA